MISLLDPRLWFAAVLLGLACYFGGQLHEGQASAARMKLADAAAKIKLKEANDRAKAAEDQMGAAHAATDEKRNKEKEDAETTINALRADVRSGALSLSIATRALRAIGPGQGAAPGYQEARAELMPETAIALIDIAADGDAAVRDLNACVDKYEAVRGAVNP
jgi:prophage endopeptidase